MPGFDVSFSLGAAPARAERRDPARPFRILVIGDFAGRAGDGAELVVHAVDFARFDALFARLQPRVELTFGARTTTLALTALDDLHPDALLRSVPELAALRRETAALRDPARAAAALAELRTKAPPTPPAAAPAPPPAPATGATAAPLASLLAQPRGAAPTTGLDGWLAALVRPHLAPALDPRADDLQRSLEAATTTALRDVLHDPVFREREAAWRGLHWLLQNVELDGPVQLAVLDAAAARVARATAGHDLRGGELQRLLVDDAGPAPFALVVLLHPFGGGERDAHTLAALGALAAAGDFAVVADGAPSLLGFADWAAAPDAAQWTRGDAAWQALRAAPQAERIAVVTPRFLLRVPYGARGEPIESFAFEEVPAAGRGGDRGFPFGAAALTVAAALARAFVDDGWALAADGPFELSGLPFHTAPFAGALHVQPSTEALLGERGVHAAHAAGLTVLQGHADRDAARVVALRSIAATAAPLRGPWRAR